MNPLSINRFVWLDSLKGIGILAVTLGHISNPYLKFIYAWHMPLFFFVSGYLLNLDTSFFNSIKKDLRNIILPFYIFGTIGILIEVLKRIALPNYSFMYPDISLLKEMVGLFVWADISQIHSYAFVLWFLPALFWARLIGLFLLKKVKSAPLVLSFSALLWLVMSNNSILFPVALDKGILASVWVVSGYYYRHLTKRKLLLFLTLSVVLLSPGNLNIATKSVANPLINYLFGLSIILIISYLCKSFLNKPGLLSVFGRNSFIIYILHPYINSISFLIVPPGVAYSWLWQFLLTGIIITVMLKLKTYVQKAHHAGIAYSV